MISLFCGNAIALTEHTLLHARQNTTQFEGFAILREGGFLENKYTSWGQNFTH